MFVPFSLTSLAYTDAVELAHLGAKTYRVSLLTRSSAQAAVTLAEAGAQSFPTKNGPRVSSAASSATTLAAATTKTPSTPAVSETADCSSNSSGRGANNSNNDDKNSNNNHISSDNNLATRVSMEEKTSSEVAVGVTTAPTPSDNEGTEEAGGGVAMAKRAEGAEQMSEPGTLEARNGEESAVIFLENDEWAALLALFTSNLSFALEGPGRESDYVSEGDGDTKEDEGGTEGVVNRRRAAEGRRRRNGADTLEGGENSTRTRYALSMVSFHALSYFWTIGRLARRNSIAWQERSTLGTAVRKPRRKQRFEEQKRKQKQVQARASSVTMPC